MSYDINRDICIHRKASHHTVTTLHVTTPQSSHCTYSKVINPHSHNTTVTTLLHHYTIPSSESSATPYSQHYSHRSPPTLSPNHTFNTLYSQNNTISSHPHYTTNPHLYPHYHYTTHLPHHTNTIAFHTLALR